LHTKEKGNIFADRIGTIAQLVEQRTENPCVPGSIPGGTTSLNRKSRMINDLRDFAFQEMSDEFMNFGTDSKYLLANYQIFYSPVR
jgi:hypothetical protein